MVPGVPKFKKIFFVFGQALGPGTKIASQDFLGNLGSWFRGPKKLKNNFPILVLGSWGPKIEK